MTSADGLPALYAWLATRGDRLRWCGACQRQHPVSAFDRSRRGPGGRSYICREGRLRHLRETAARHKAGHGVRGRS